MGERNALANRVASHPHVPQCWLRKYLGIELREIAAL